MRRILAFTFLTSAGCGALVKLEPVKVEPIRMTIDVNVHNVPAPTPGGVEPGR
jgi:hypothetical protein